MSKIWITSDTHFGHVNICGPSMTRWKDGFRNFSSLEEMENVLIYNTNQLVQPDDEIIHAGDVFMGQVEANAKRIRERINCRTIHLIYGNHDEKIKKQPALQRLFSSVQLGMEMRVNGKLVVISHYPHVVWHENGKGAVHLHGHCHGSYKHPGKAIDVGVDCWDFKPLELEFAVSEASKKPFYLPDHHGKNVN